MIHSKVWLSYPPKSLIFRYYGLLITDATLALATLGRMAVIAYCRPSDLKSTQQSPVHLWASCVEVSFARQWIGNVATRLLLCNWARASHLCPCLWCSLDWGTTRWLRLGIAVTQQAMSDASVLAGFRLRSEVMVKIIEVDWFNLEGISRNTIP